jgi:hypothetical protein
MIQNGLDGILIVFGINGGRFWGNTAWEEDGVIVVERFKAMGMDFGVNPVFLGQLQSIIRSFWFGLSNLKWSNITGIKLCTSSFLLDAKA